MSGLFDPGLQPERTELAWRRTALALAAGSLIAMRLLPAVFDDLGWVSVGVAGLVASGAIWVLARRRYRAYTAALTDEDGRRALPGAGAILALALLVTATGAVALAVVWAAAAS